MEGKIMSWRSPSSLIIKEEEEEEYWDDGNGPDEIWWENIEEELVELIIKLLMRDVDDDGEGWWYCNCWCIRNGAPAKLEVWSDGGGGGGEMIIPRVPREVMGQGWVCVPSYVVTTMVGSSQDRSTLFFTPHAALVQR